LKFETLVSVKFDEGFVFGGHLRGAIIAIIFV
jgi:hypothetical protein